MPLSKDPASSESRQCIVVIEAGNQSGSPILPEKRASRSSRLSRSLIILCIVALSCFLICALCRLYFSWISLQMDEAYSVRIAQVENLWSLISVSGYFAGKSAPDHKSSPRRTRRMTTTSNTSRQLPQAIIIGVKKGGTRALLEYMRMHPQIRAPGSEMHFFDRHYERGLDWYRNQMPETTEGQITIEKTPSYFVTREAPRRIYEMNKKTKLIVVVRDPITRAISDYTQARSKGRSSRSFQEMAFYSNGTHQLLDTSWGALRIGLYAEHLAKWLKYFPLEQMLFISGEELIHNPMASVDKVQDFLNLDKLIRPENFYFDPIKGFPCLRRPEMQLRPRCLGKSKGRRHPRVSRDVIGQLRDFYQPFNQKFYRLVGTHFGWD